MKYINEHYIELINKKLNENNFEGIIFFVSDKNYARFVKPLSSSLELFAEKWLHVYFKVGDFKLKNNNRHNLIQITLENKFSVENEKKAFCANVRVPLFYELIKSIYINKLIYTDVDNILMNNINNLFHDNEYKIFTRKVKKNLIDYTFNNSNIMQYKSGVIALRTPRKQYLYNDTEIKEFIECFNNICKSNLNLWFQDQLALQTTFQIFPEISKCCNFDSKICDWDLNSSSIFWAAKGYIKNTLIWQFSSYKIVILSKLNKLVLFKNQIKARNILFSLNKLTNLFIQPFIFLRFTVLNYFFRTIRYIFKKLFEFSKILSNF